MNADKNWGNLIEPAFIGVHLWLKILYGLGIFPGTTDETRQKTERDFDPRSSVFICG
jgi:hypothetical protein